MKPSPMTTFLARLDTPGFKYNNQKILRQEAITANSFLAYYDEQGRFVREYPAREETYEILPTKPVTYKLITTYNVENQPKLRAATDELALLEFDIDALQSHHGLPVDEAALAAKQQRALDLYATIYELRNPRPRRAVSRAAPSFCK